MVERIYLTVGDPGGLAREARSVSTPTDPGYGRYLTPEQIEERFALDERAVATVRDWLTAAGLTVDQDDWRSLRASGTVAQFENAFAVSFHRYQVIGGSYVIATTDLSVPAAAGRYVLGVSRPIISYGADTTAYELREQRDDGLGAASLPGSRNTDTCSRYWGERSATELPKAYGKHQLGAAAIHRGSCSAHTDSVTASTPDPG